MVGKIRVFALTELGKRIASKGAGDDEEIRVLQFLSSNKASTSDEVEVAGGERYILRRLKERGLVKELTTEDK